jgi:cation diffusion facilitator family transporter
VERSVLQRKTAVAILSVVSNSVLVILKLVVGISIGAVSIISEALHSAVDLLAAIIALAAVRISGRQADEDHPYGHGKYENISGAVEALLIFVAAAWITYEAIHKLMKPAPLAAVGWGIIVMLVSAVANTIVSARLFKVGRETDSLALQADACIPRWGSWWGWR